MLLQWWGELHAGRQVGMAGPMPLAWGDIAAWAALTGRAPSPQDVAVLRAIDAAWLDEARRQHAAREEGHGPPANDGTAGGAGAPPPAAFGAAGSRPGRG